MSFHVTCHSCPSGVSRGRPLLRMVHCSHCHLSFTWANRVIKCTSCSSDNVPCLVPEEMDSPWPKINCLQLIFQPTSSSTRSRKQSKSCLPKFRTPRHPTLTSFSDPSLPFFLYRWRSAHEACAFYDPLSAAAPFLRSESVEIYIFIRFGECARDNYYILWGLVSAAVRFKGRATPSPDRTHRRSHFARSFSPIGTWMHDSHKMQVLVCFACFQAFSTDAYMMFGRPWIPSCPHPFGGLEEIAFDGASNTLL